MPFLTVEALTTLFDCLTGRVGGVNKINSINRLTQMHRSMPCSVG